MHIQKVWIDHKEDIVVKSGDRSKTPSNGLKVRVVRLLYRSSGNPRSAVRIEL